MALSTSTNGGGITGQINTQNPQTATAPAGGASSSSGVQPGTATSLLTTGNGGVPLYATSLPTVSLGQSPSASRTVTSTPSATPPKHKVDPALFALPALLVVVALVVFWAARRSVKSTTE